MFVITLPTVLVELHKIYINFLQSHPIIVTVYFTCFWFWLILSI